jgi:hypothetical protein
MIFPFKEKAIEILKILLLELKVKYFDAFVLLRSICCYNSRHSRTRQNSSLVHAVTAATDILTVTDTTAANAIAVSTVIRASLFLKLPQVP